MEASRQEIGKAKPPVETVPTKKRLSINNIQAPLSL